MLCALVVTAACGAGGVINYDDTQPSPPAETAVTSSDSATSDAVATASTEAVSNASTTVATRTGAAPEVAPAVKPKPARRSVTILGSGDVLLHDYLWRQALADGDGKYDFRPLYRGVRSEVRAADIAICEMETPLAAKRGPYDDWPRFNVPPQIAKALAKTGYDVCTTASNHTLDKGEQGVLRTLDTLDAAGIAHTGSARSAKEAKRPLIIEAGTANAAGERVKVAIVAATFSFNGLTRPAGKSWMANLIDVNDVLAQAARAKKKGADIVIAALHWGVEYSHLPSATQRAQAKALTASSDIDLILGAHAHVVQPIEKINGTWVFYGMGNQVARHANPIDATREGIMPVVTFTENAKGRFKVSAVRVVPTWMRFAPKFRLVNLTKQLLRDDLSAASRRQYEAAVKRITSYVTALGEDMPFALP